MLYLCSQYLHKKLKVMALETRPFPELSGQALTDFLEKVKNFKCTTPPEEVKESIRLYREMMERSRKMQMERSTKKEQNG
jgi:hypothetical protein